MTHYLNIYFSNELFRFVCTNKYTCTQLKKNNRETRKDNQVMTIQQIQATLETRHRTKIYNAKTKKTKENPTKIVTGQ